MRALPARLLFLLALLAVSGAYTATAFRLPWTTAAGRIGPGFFPRIVGVSLLLVLVTALLHARREHDEAAPRTHVRTTLVVVGLTALFVPVLQLLGALLGMALYLLASLSFLNPRRLVTNVSVSVGLAVGMYLLFDVWLNTATPRGVVPLPL